MKPEKKSPKAEAIEALRRVQIELTEDLTPMQRTITRGLVEYALEQLGLVQELKRPRGKNTASARDARDA